MLNTCRCRKFHNFTPFEAKMGKKGKIVEFWARFSWSRLKIHKSRLRPTIFTGQRLLDAVENFTYNGCAISPLYAMLHLFETLIFSDVNPQNQICQASIYHQYYVYVSLGQAFYNYTLIDRPRQCLFVILCKFEEDIDLNKLIFNVNMVFTLQTT